MTLRALPSLANQIEEAAFAIEEKFEILEALGQEDLVQRLRGAANIVLEVARKVRQGQP